MAEATSSITQFPTIRITTAAHALAMLRARNAIKDALRKQGLKVAQYSAREISSWASVYLDDNAAKLIPDAIAQAERMILSGAFGKRAQRALCANLMGMYRSTFLRFANSV
jgi:DNA-directed RNA polymerase specialized sigma24 family protein